MVLCFLVSLPFCEQPCHNKDGNKRLNYNTNENEPVLNNDSLLIDECFAHSNRKKKNRPKKSILLNY